MYVRDADTNVGDMNRRMTRALLLIANRMVGRVTELQYRQGAEHSEDWIRNVRSTLGIDIAAIINNDEIAPALALFSEGTAGKIRGLTTQLAGDISRDTIEALRLGQSQRELSRTLALKYNETLHGRHVGRTAESRERNMARKRVLLRRHTNPATGTGTPYRYQSRFDLIARDQIAKLTSELDRIRQEQAGVSKYRWVTSRDERVRSSHKSKQGREIRWDRPPDDTGHPGDDYQCRCLAMAIIE